MSDYADSVANDAISSEVRNAIHGAGAFRSFRDVLRRRRMENDWAAFRLRTLQQIARAWSKEHGIPFK